MEYVYAAMILHKAGKDVTEKAVEKVLDAAGVKPDSARVKALVAALKDVNIDEAIEKSSVAVAAPASVSAAPVSSGEAAGAEATEEEKAEEEEKKDEEAAAGLGALFG
ncbi:50S ribosomal protein P1 [Candidatus Woesearchaeota archaeon]|nr:50S ribosomal protein P1 [Candidatus Woesearchaeota archaeon]